MSRTIRRTSITPSWVTRDVDWIAGHIQWYELEGADRAIAVSKYHRDAYETMSNAPKWYRQDLNRKLRRKQNMQIKNCKDFDNLALHKYVCNDGYYW